MGLSWQENLDVIIDMSNVLTSLGVPMERLAKETETIFSGKGVSQSYVAQRLKLDSDTLKSWGQGKDFLENFNKQFGQMKYAGESAASTFTAVKAYYDDVMDSIAAESTKSVFDNLKIAMLSVADAFFEINKETNQFQVSDKMKGLLEFLNDVGSWTSEGFANSVASLMGGLETLSGLIGDNREAIAKLGDSFGSAAKVMLAYVAAKKLGITSLIHYASTLLFMDNAQRKAALSAKALAISQAGLASLKTGVASLIGVFGGIPGIIAKIAIMGIGYLMTSQEKAIPVSEKYADAWSNVKSELAGIPSVARDASAAFKELSETQKKAKLGEITLELQQSYREIATGFAAVLKEADAVLPNSLFCEGCVKHFSGKTQGLSFNVFVPVSPLKAEIQLSFGVEHKTVFHG